MYILLSPGTLCIHYPHLSTSTDGALNINCVDKPTQPRFKLLHSALVLPNFYSCIRWSIEHQDRCSMTVVEYMFSTRQRCCKPDKSPTQGLPAPSHFALQRWHVCLLFFLSLSSWLRFTRLIVLRALMVGGKRVSAVLRRRGIEHWH